MDRFIHRENLALYRRLLPEPNVANDHVRHHLLLQLLADEEAKNAIHGPPPFPQGYLADRQLRSHGSSRLG
jgi:hypothetical protein